MLTCIPEWNDRCSYMKDTISALIRVKCATTRSACLFSRISIVLDPRFLNERADRPHGYSMENSREESDSKHFLVSTGENIFLSCSSFSFRCKNRAKWKYFESFLIFNWHLNWPLETMRVRIFNLIEF